LSSSLRWVAEEDMQQGHGFAVRIFLGGLLAVSGAGIAQTKQATVPDAQVESDVLKALAGVPQLADQSISTTTVYGTVTISGTVRDEASRDMAEKVVSNTPGVKKVVDELTVGAGAPAATGVSQPPQDDASEGTNPNLQSDGTMAPAQPQQGQQPGAEQSPAGAPPQQPQVTQQQGYPQGQAQQQGYPQQQGAPDQQGQPQQQAGQPPAYPPPPYRRPYSRPYGPPPAPYYPGYPQQQQQPAVAQRGGDAVVVPSGTLVRVRINQAMDSKHTPPGTAFDGVVLSDVMAGGAIAIPRGAPVQGTVVNAESSGALKGRGEIALQLTQMTLGGRTYPLVSDVWAQQGRDKSLQTANTALGLGAVGAIIGGVAGGGAGAAIGAGVGAAAGLGASAASGSGNVGLPAEAILTFKLTQPTELTTVSQAELNRLGYGVAPPQQLQRRYPPPPPPPPYYYGPVYYPRY
jgi:hypothetical protein